MSDKRLFDHDPLTGITRWFQYDDSDKSFTIQTQQETEELIEQNKRESNDASSGWTGDWHKVASIPLSIFVRLQKEGIVNDQEAMKKWLNDPSNSFFRTKHGTV